MTLTCNQFVTQSYRLINPANPTQPLHGDDFKLGLLILNQLVDSYAATGLLLTIAQQVSIPIIAGQGIITVGPATVLPLPTISIGRLANLDSAWLNLDGVDYPLIDENRDEFLASFKYAPLQGLPRFIITYPGTDIVTLQLYPAPSQAFTFNIRGKFQLPNLAANGTLAGFPGYYIRYLLFAVAKDLAMYKARMDAWTDKLEAAFIEARDIMVAASEVNLTICGDRASLLNANWRVQAGI
jgi:hypothetical protein